MPAAHQQTCRVRSSAPGPACRLRSTQGSHRFEPPGVQGLFILRRETFTHLLRSGVPDPPVRTVFSLLCRFLRSSPRHPPSFSPQISSSLNRLIMSTTGGTYRGNRNLGRGRVPEFDNGSSHIPRPKAEASTTHAPSEVGSSTMSAASRQRQNQSKRDEVFTI